MTTQHDINKLPKWAQTKMRLLQEEIQRLESTVSAQNAEINASDSQIWARHSPLSPWMLLKRGASVEFQTEHGEIRAQIIDGMLALNAMGGALVLRPEAANAISIEVMRW